MCMPIVPTIAASALGYGLVNTITSSKKPDYNLLSDDAPDIFKNNLNKKSIDGKINQKKRRDNYKNNTLSNIYTSPLGLNSYNNGVSKTTLGG